MSTRRRYRGIPGAFATLAVTFMLGVIVMSPTPDNAFASSSCARDQGCIDHIDTNYPGGYICANGNEGTYSHCTVKWQGGGPHVTCHMDCGGIGDESFALDEPE
jgi:hypothetical protein